MKATFHKSCSCHACKRGRNRTARQINERKLRRKSRDAIYRFIAGREADVFVAPISSPFTD